jgi:uncharacterized protein YbaR (Trm112 family)
VTIHQWLLDILACPTCRGKVRLEEGGGRIICDACRVAYPVDRTGDPAQPLDIPQMLVEKAVPLGDPKP